MLCKRLVIIPLLFLTATLGFLPSTYPIRAIVLSDAELDKVCVGGFDFDLNAAYAFRAAVISQANIAAVVSVNNAISSANNSRIEINSFNNAVIRNRGDSALASQYNISAVFAKIGDITDTVINNLNIADVENIFEPEPPAFDSAPVKEVMLAAEIPDLTLAVAEVVPLAAEVPITTPEPTAVASLVPEKPITAILDAVAVLMTEASGIVLEPENEAPLAVEAPVTVPEPEVVAPLVTEAPVVAPEPVAEAPVIAEAPGVAFESVVEAPVFAEAPGVAFESVVEAPVIAEAAVVAPEPVAEAPVIAEAPGVAPESVVETPVIAETPAPAPEPIAVAAVAPEPAPPKAPEIVEASVVAPAPAATLATLTPDSTGGANVSASASAVVVQTNIAAVVALYGSIENTSIHNSNVANVGNQGNSALAAQTNIAVMIAGGFIDNIKVANSNAANVANIVTTDKGGAALNSLFYKGVLSNTNFNNVVVNYEANATQKNITFITSLTGNINNKLVKGLLSRKVINIR